MFKRHFIPNSSPKKQLSKSKLKALHLKGEVIEPEGSDSLSLDKGPQPTHKPKPKIDPNHQGHFSLSLAQPHILEQIPQTYTPPQTAAFESPVKPSSHGLYYMRHACYGLHRGSLRQLMADDRCPSDGLVASRHAGVGFEGGERAGGGLGRGGDRKSVV